MSPKAQRLVKSLEPELEGSASERPLGPHS